MKLHAYGAVTLRAVLQYHTCSILQFNMIQDSARWYTLLSCYNRLQYD